MRLMPLLLLAAALSAATVFAAEPTPEIARAAAAPQTTGAAHTLRSIPEACARLEGVFTGQPEAPYRFAVVRTSPNCQPRARFVDAAKAKPSAAGGWLLNDLIQVPSARCPTQRAVVQVWRKPGQAATPELDAQGRARIYLGDSRQAADDAKLSVVTRFAAQMEVQGTPCD